jgi:hypothetical protein
MSVWGMPGHGIGRLPVLKATLLEFGDLELIIPVKYR